MTDTGGTAERSRLSRAVFLVVGLLFVAIGLVGVALPVLPTTPFLILAVACFARSSLRLEAWLLDHPRFGPPLRLWRDRGAIPPRAKAAAAAGSALGFVLFQITTHPGPLATATVALFMLGGLGYVLTRPS
jgi:uncharacterized membrane protein YbaN (DUF454 family)